MTLKRLREILTGAGIDFIISAEGSAKFAMPDTYACDYMRFLAGDADIIAKYNGEYMSEYSWAEETNARLSNIKENRETPRRR